MDSTNILVWNVRGLKRADSATDFHAVAISSRLSRPVPHRAAASPMDLPIVDLAPFLGAAAAAAAGEE